MGFEPTYNGFAARPLASTSTEKRSTFEQAPEQLGAHKAEDPNLATVVEAWPKLPEGTRKAVKAMIEAADQTRHAQHSIPTCQTWRAHLRAAPA